MTHDIVNPEDRERLSRLADFLFEVGMLRKTERTGYQFLGSGAENVAEHSFRTAIIGYTLAVMTERDTETGAGKVAKADPYRTTMLCLFHDLHEARTGDFNYVYKRYNKSDPVRAITDALVGTGMRERILDLWEELEGCDTRESLLAQDADQIDLILNLKEELDLGNRYATKWLEHAVKRLRTDEGRRLTDQILQTDHTDWWFKIPDPAWWSQKNGKDRKGSLGFKDNTVAQHPHDSKDSKDSKDSQDSKIAKDSKVAEGSNVDTVAGSGPSERPARTDGPGCSPESDDSLEPSKP